MHNNYLCILFIVSLSLGGWWIFSRYKPLLVTTGSMEPHIPRGAIVFTEETKFAKEGEVITYKLPNLSLATHRVVTVEKLGWERIYHTKGDANAYPDEIAVGSNEIVGKVVFTLPYVGYILQLLISPLFLLFFFYLPIGFTFGASLKKFVNHIHA